MTTITAAPARPALRVVRVFGSAAVATLVTGIAAAIVGCVITRATPLVVVSGSMAPAINAGDLIVVRSTPIEDVEAGQVVTFSDKDRGGDLVTHRVESIVAAVSGYEVVTRGDANTAREEWGVAAGSSVGRYILRVPRLGLVAAAAAKPAVLLFGFLAAIAVFALRLIWRS